MNDEVKYRIDLAERLHVSKGKRKDFPWYHGYLALREQYSPNSVATVQELHFNAYEKRVDGIGPVTAYVREVFEEEYEPQTLHFTSLFIGNEIDIMPRWNHGLEYAGRVKNAGVMMDYGHKRNPRSLNCYQLIEDTVNAMGLSMDVDLRVSKAGSEAKKMTVKPKASFDDAVIGGENTDVIEKTTLILQRNRELILSLPAPEVLDARALARLNTLA